MIKFTFGSLHKWPWFIIVLLMHLSSRIGVDENGTASSYRSINKDEALSPIIHAHTWSMYFGQKVIWLISLANPEPYETQTILKQWKLLPRLKSKSRSQANSYRLYMNVNLRWHGVRAVANRNFVPIITRVKRPPSVQRECSRKEKAQMTNRL